MAHEAFRTSGEVEVRARDGQPSQIVGYAAKFNRYSQNLGGYVEQIAPGAFAKTIAEADIRGLFNHNPDLILGRNTSGTLRLEEDGTGLRYEIDLADTQAARDVATVISRGDVSGSSFSFRATGDGVEWGFTDQDVPLRTLTQVQLYDVGPVTFPAYLDTEADTKRAAAYSEIAERCGVPLDEVRDAAERVELRSLFSARMGGSMPEQHSTSSLPVVRAVRAARLAEVIADAVTARYEVWQRTAGR